MAANIQSMVLLAPSDIHSTGDATEGAMSMQCQRPGCDPPGIERRVTIELSVLSTHLESRVRSFPCERSFPILNMDPRAYYCLIFGQL